MSKKKFGKKKVWIGVDWGHQEHAATVVTSSGKVLEQFLIPNSPQGYALLKMRLASFGEILGIAVESTRHSLLEFLKQERYTIYAINPKMSKAWRETETISDAKSDERDGLALGRGLAFRHGYLKVLEQGDPRLERLALLCEKEAALINKRTAHIQELKSQLTLYYPMALEFFDSWSAPAAWDFLLRFPSPGKLTRAREKSVVDFLRKHHLGHSAPWKKRLEMRRQGNDWPVHPMEEVYAIYAQCLARMLRELEENLKRFREQIEELCNQLPEVALLKSIPGVGEKLAPRLMSILGSQVAQQGGLEAIRGHSGVAPVTIASGKREQVRIRYMCNKFWRNTFHLFAWCSTRFSKWAEAFYNYRKDKGDTHSSALRKLADKWLKIIMRMFETKEAYDEERYLEALKRSNSPTWEYLQKNSACG